MGSPVPKEPNSTNAPQSSVAPETLARLVLRCRELTTFLEQALPRLPAREETPFLYGQLDDVLQRLQANLRQLASAEPAGSDKGSSFLRRLAGAGKKPREQQPRRSEPRYDLQGNAWTIPVTELVGFLSHSGKSGLLWVTSPAETFVLEFARGSLVHATSNAPPVAYRLGEILLDEKLLSASELAEVIDYAKAADDLLGSYLVRTGRLQHTDLQRALSIQVQQLFHRLMDAENALYRFQEGAQLLRSQSLEVNITQLLLESARKKDEERLSAERREAEARAKEAERAEPERGESGKGKSAGKSAEKDAEAALARLEGEEKPPSKKAEKSAEKSSEKAAEKVAAKAEKHDDDSEDDEPSGEGASKEPQAALPKSEPGSPGGASGPGAAGSASAAAASTSAAPSAASTSASNGASSSTRA